MKIILNLTREEAKTLVWWMNRKRKPCMPELWEESNVSPFMKTIDKAFCKLLEDLND